MIFNEFQSIFFFFFFIELTDSMIASQAFVFFVAGFETSSSTISHALYELAQNQEIQDKLREEIREVYEKYGELTYDVIKNMKYLDKILKGKKNYAKLDSFY